MMLRTNPRALGALFVWLSLSTLSTTSLACGGDDDGGTPDGSVTRDGGGGGGRDGGPGSDGGGGGGDDGGVVVPPSAECTPLPAPSGMVVNVTPADANDLASIVSSAAANTTIVLGAGTYRTTMSGEENRRLIFRQSGVTLRGETDDASDVVIDGEYATNELLYIVASNVTVANLTLTHAVDHLAHVTSETSASVTGTRFQNVRFIDGGEQFLKVNPGGMDGWIDDGEVACSFFQMTDAGRPHVERAVGGCYTGGIDAHAARGWVVHHNAFDGIYCAGEGLAEHAVHFWRSGRDTVVENNQIVNCARGIGFGLGDSEERRVYPDDPYSGIRPIQHFDGVIRNNVIWSDIDYYDTGIELQNARGARVIHNTVVNADGAGFFSSIDYRFSTTEVTIQNNLTRRITMRDGAGGEVSSNLENTPDATFVDVGARDFHLAASASDAIDQGVVVDDAGLDIDGETHDRGSAPDLGADER